MLAVEWCRKREACCSMRVRIVSPRQTEKNEHATHTFIMFKLFHKTFFYRHLLKLNRHSIPITFGPILLKNESIPFGGNKRITGMYTLIEYSSKTDSFLNLCVHERRKNKGSNFWCGQAIDGQGAWNKTSFTPHRIPQEYYYEYMVQISIGSSHYRW